MKVRLSCGQCERWGDYEVPASSAFETYRFCLFEGFSEARELEITDEGKWQAFETAQIDLGDLKEKYEKVLERLNQQGRNI